MKKLLIILIGFSCFGAQAQCQTKEFEGEIQYLHLFTFKEKNLDTSAIRDVFGISSQYYYKAGAYKWLFDEGAVLEEYYTGASGKTYNKYRGSDTLFIHPDVSGDSIVRYEITENADTICGYVCNRIKVITMNKFDKKQVLLRYIYYAPALPVNPENFKRFGAFSNYEVYGITQSVFLAIEMHTPDWPFALRFQAVKVTERSLQQKEVGLPQGAIISGNKN